MWEANNTKTALTVVSATEGSLAMGQMVGRDGGGLPHASGQGKPVCEGLKGEKVAATGEPGSTKDQVPGGNTDHVLQSRDRRPVKNRSTEAGDAAGPGGVDCVGCGAGLRNTDLFSLSSVKAFGQFEAGSAT